MGNLNLRNRLSPCGDYTLWFDQKQILKASSRQWPRSVSRKTSNNDVKKLLLFEELQYIGGSSVILVVIA